MTNELIKYFFKKRKPYNNIRGEFYFDILVIVCLCKDNNSMIWTGRTSCYVGMVEKLPSSRGVSNKRESWAFVFEMELFCCLTSFLSDPYSLQPLMKRWFHPFVSVLTQGRLHLWILRFLSQVIRCKQLFKVFEKNWGLLTGCGPYSNLFRRAVSQRDERL